jgi:cell division protein FtsI/penicillin-binding protein 2
MSLLAVFLILFVALTVRLGYIQLLKGGEYRQQVKRQSLSLISEIPVRGTIYDRENRPLTNAEKGFYVLVDERKVNGEFEEIISRVKAEKVESSSDKYRIYSIPKIGSQALNKLFADYGVLVLEYSQRDDPHQSAIHVIGGISPLNHVGLWGIEKDYDHILSSEQRMFYALNDGQGNLISGNRINIESDGHHWGVLTTLDMDMQTAVEKSLRRCMKSGTVIVVDINTGEVLAFASTLNPSLEPQNEMYRAEFLSQLIAAGAASEKCIDSEQVFSVENADIIEIAEALGMTTNGVANLNSQSSGNFNEITKRILEFNDDFSILENELMLTPMQVARLNKTLAKDGLDQQLTLIRGTLEGIRGASLLPKAKEQQVISADTSKMLKDLLCEIVEKGGNWYTGYVPWEEPVFGITVYAEDNNGENRCAASLFKDVAERIH